MTSLPQQPDRSAANATTELSVRRVGPYRLLRRVAAGGMSSVYQAYDDVSRQTVAVKVLADPLSTKPEFVRRFRREARLTQLLRHPNIVQGLSSGYDRNVEKHYLALEYIAGPTAAATVLSLERLPIAIVVRIGIDIASALSYIHRIHFVHRDVKPENILFDPNGTAKLADFGLVKKVDGTSDLTASNQGVGTPYYMPHEQAQNSSIVDGRSDIFSLGATLYHLATGELPFPGETQEVIEEGKKTGLFRRASSIHSEIPEAIDGILTRMLNRDVRHRFQQASDVVAELTATGLAASPEEFAAFIEFASSPNDAKPADTLAATRPDLVIRSETKRTRSGPRFIAFLGFISLCSFFSGSMHGPEKKCTCPPSTSLQSFMPSDFCRPEPDRQSQPPQVLDPNEPFSMKM
jgi:serine/threonine protein kinase